MKKVIFMGVLGLFLLGSCNSKSGDSHEGHNHETEEHNHDGLMTTRDKTTNMRNTNLMSTKEETGKPCRREAMKSSSATSKGASCRRSSQQLLGTGVSISHQDQRPGDGSPGRRERRPASYSSRRGFLFKGKVIEGMSVSKGTRFGGIVIQNMADGDTGAESR